MTTGTVAAHVWPLFPTSLKNATKIIDDRKIYQHLSVLQCRQQYVQSWSAIVLNNASEIVAAHVWPTFLRKRKSVLMVRDLRQTIVWNRYFFLHGMKAEFQCVMFCWLCKTRIGGDSFSSTITYLLDFYTNKTKQYLQAKIIVPWWNITCCLQFRWKSNSQIFITIESCVLKLCQQYASRTKKN